jgi:adenylate kinase
MLICISGTPGTGKTTLAKIISEELGFPVLDVKKFIKSKKISEGYDKKRECEIVDTKKLVKEIVNEIKKVKSEKFVDGIIVDSHLSHYLPKRYVDMCIITKCGLKELNKRLKKRKYSKTKIRENLDAEIFDICLNEAKENGHYTFVINTTKSIKKEMILQLSGEIDASKSTSN